MDLYTYTQHMLLTQEDMCVWQPIQLALNANELICKFLVKVLGLDKYMCLKSSFIIVLVLTDNILSLAPF